jgi:hypothetical protein
VRASGRGPRRGDRRTEAGLDVRYGGGSGPGAWHGTRHRAHGRERLAPASCSKRLGPVQLCFTPIFSTEVNKVINSKVVDLLILYHLHKGRIAFFSVVFAQIGCQDAEFLSSGE